MKTRLLPALFLLFGACTGKDTADDSTDDSASDDSASDDSASDDSATDDSGAVEGDYNTLWIPPLLSGTQFDLTLADSSKEFFEGGATPTYGYNGESFWGPTLVMRKGDFVSINVTNELSDMTTTHWHGFHIPAEMDGGPHQPIESGTTWSPSFEIMNNAATYWYHPHLHMTTAQQLAMGAGGLIIVQDSVEDALPLPRTYGTDDIPLVLTSRKFTNSNAIQTDAVYGDYMLTNGTLDAAVELPQQLVRFRILNADIERSYNLGFSDDRTFYVITTDGGLVDAPIPVTRLPMWVGERYEVLVDLSGDAVGDSLELMAYNSGQEFGFPGAEPNTSGQFGSLLNNADFEVLHIEVGEATEGAILELPGSLVSNVYPSESEADLTRTVRITDQGPGTPFTFDDAAFDEDVINQSVALGATEVWTISNNETFGHSFHIHDIQFKIIARSDREIADYEQGWKDVVSVPVGESVSFITRFDDFASDTHPYMYHCHMANHEDGGLMGQFLVQ